MEKTRENSQVALVAWTQGHGLGGEPVDYVAEVHYFNSKKQAGEFQKADWIARGCPMDKWNPLLDEEGIIIGNNPVPAFRFQRVQRGTGDWKYAIPGYIVEMGREEALRYFA